MKDEYKGLTCWHHSKGEKITTRWCIGVEAHSVDIKYCTTKSRYIPEGVGRRKDGLLILEFSQMVHYNWTAKRRIWLNEVVFTVPLV